MQLFLRSFLVAAALTSADALAEELSAKSFKKIKGGKKAAFVKVCSYISLPQAPLPHACDACASSRASRAHAFLTRHLLCFLFAVSAQFLAPW